MSLWERLFGKHQRVAVSSTSGIKKDSTQLPPIEQKYLHRSFGKCERGPTPGPGGKLMDEAIPHWNENRYDKAFDLLTKSLSAGLGEPDASYAHSWLGQIHVKRRELIPAVEEFLKCLELQGRARDATWESAIRLSVIYKTAGKLDDARSLEGIAQTADVRGLSLAPAGIQDLEKLTRQSLSTR